MYSENILNPNLTIIRTYCKYKNKYLKNNIPFQKAIILVDEGRAFVLTNKSITIPLNHKEFNKYILERDNYTCKYCGEFGDTIDHIKPRSKGGYSTPKNCVCACYDCNQEKGSKIMFG
jgi:hypothetical protein